MARSRPSRCWRPSREACACRSTNATTCSASPVTPCRPRAAHRLHVNPVLLRVLDRLQDTPAQVVTELGEILAQTPPAAAIFGDQTRPQRTRAQQIYRWFADP